MNRKQNNNNHHIKKISFFVNEKGNIHLSVLIVTALLPAAVVLSLFFSKSGRNALERPLSAVGFIIVAVVLSVTSALLLKQPLTKIKLGTKSLYFLAGLFLFYIACILLLSNLKTIPPELPLSVLLPTVLVTALASVLISFRTGVMFSVILSVFAFFLTNFEFESFLFVLCLGIASTYILNDAKQRIDLVRGSFLLSLVSFFIMFMLTLLQPESSISIWLPAGIAAANGFLSGILSIGFLPLFENILNSATVFRLMELSDLNSPILKKMLAQAPGTFTHSISVANLAETAAKEIGAYSLLARVGGYYHDIGKIDQPSYFSENQKSTNKHDDLKPSLSASIIKSHVRMGGEKAKELGLPPEVIRIIYEHHGSSLIKWFYTKAVDAEGSGEVGKEDYCYAGPLPSSKEAAVVMLADAVEAASRSLEKPSSSRIEKLAVEIIMDRFKNGQLKNAPITFKDLEIIKKTFIQILAGYFHSRIEYPQGKEAAS